MSVVLPQHIHTLLSSKNPIRINFPVLVRLLLCLRIILLVVSPDPKAVFLRMSVTAYMT